MADPRRGLHKWRQGFYNGKGKLPLKDLTLHLTDFDSITYANEGSRVNAVCGEPADKFHPSTTIQIATQLNHSTVCAKCQSLAELETETL
jgi:hypothetical protein